LRSPAILLVIFSLASCDKPTHEHIDAWRTTERGPSKLQDALESHGLDVDLRAHAAQNLVSIGKGDVVLTAFKAMKPDERPMVLDKLLPRLWSEAEIPNKLSVPSDRQAAAKDALFDLRAFANDREKGIIDGYLTDWLGGFYVGRSTAGLHSGEMVLKTIGARATPKLVAEAREIVEHPMVGNKMVALQPSLLTGIAVSGGADGVGFLMDLADGKLTYPDPAVADKALNSLFDAYNDPAARPDGAGLAANIDHLVRWASDPKLDGKFGNIGYALIEASGKAACLPAFLPLAKNPDPIRMYKAVAGAVTCAGADAVAATAEALPTERAYPRAEINPNYWMKIVELGPAAAGPARTLLGSKSWVGRLTGVEVLDAVGTKADADLVRKLAGDQTVLKGWWGEEKKGPDPTLGAEAAAVADRLQKK
jgi:hypothetical protein